MWKRKRSTYYALAMIIIVTGIVGTVMGLIYGSQYWYDTSHPIIFSYGQLATIVRPILAVIGLVLFVVMEGPQEIRSNAPDPQK